MSGFWMCILRYTSKKNVQKALLPHLLSGLNSLQLIKLNSNFKGENRVTRSDHKPSSHCVLFNTSHRTSHGMSPPMQCLHDKGIDSSFTCLPFPPQQECKTQGKCSLICIRHHLNGPEKKDLSNHMHTLVLQWQEPVPFVVMCGASDSTPLQITLQPNPNWLLQAVQYRILRDVSSKGEKTFGCCTFTFQEHKIHEKGKPNHRQSQMETFYHGVFCMFCIKKEKIK